MSPHRPAVRPARLAVRPARPGDLLGAAEARVASWRAAFTGLVPQDFLDAMDPAAIASSWTESIAAGRSRLYIALTTDPHQPQRRDRPTDPHHPERQPERRGRGVERVVGYVSVGPERDPGAPPDTGELYALFVHPDHWGVGVGRALADAACADLRAAGCTTVNLWVLEANTRARRFYAKYSFEDTGDRGRSSLNELPEIRLSLSQRPS
ncbi:GNAT family N-acetyltransferase [Kribbella sp. HUAS MG21]|uniref:GNAT family N-acetyltransferase n=1 Tax=Kribbella sp. HUAS MG21 TaxID=3160966 RepID=A0AAU7TQ15_9ACTN